MTSLGDRVLDLQAGVHLHEEELVGPVGGDDELDGARAGVVDAARGVARRRADAGPGRRVQQRRRRLLDDLLVAPLQAALALAEVDDVAVAVGEHLHLDVPGVQHESLEEQGVVAERRRRLAARGLTSAAGSSAASCTTRMPLPPPPADGLTSTGKPTSRGAGDQVVVGQAGPRDAGHDGHTERRHRRLGGDLVAHGLDRRRPAGR